MSNVREYWLAMTASPLNRGVGYALASLLGAAAGYVYWQQIGCTSGSCAITSDPVNSTLYGAMMGALLLNAILPQKKRTENGKA